ncbi:MAG: signal peptidase I [Actinomycetota bacterium]|nr:signal peptidase I [Actinomycetota bacterium]
MGKHLLSSKKEKSRSKELLSYLIVILCAALVSILFRIFLFEPFIVPSPSMEPTLMVNDKVIVNKFSYKYFGIERGDLITFHSPIDNNKDLVKRAIAFEGETITLKDDGSIYINDEKLERDFYNPNDKPIYREESYKIGKNEIFVMGDNRNNSYDSRYFGPVMETEVFGKVFFIYWPPSRIKVVN